MMRGKLVDVEPWICPKCGRQFGKTVIGVEGAADVDGVVHVTSAKGAVERVAGAILGVD